MSGAFGISNAHQRQRASRSIGNEININRQSAATRCDFAIVNGTSGTPAFPNQLRQWSTRREQKFSIALDLIGPPSEQIFGCACSKHDSFVFKQHDRLFKALQQSSDTLTIIFGLMKRPSN